MMISDEQARAAARDVREGRVSDSVTGLDVSEQTLQRAREAVLQAPDVRAERVLEACTRLLASPLDSRDLADKMISRIVSDAVR